MLLGSWAPFDFQWELISSTWFPANIAKRGISRSDLAANFILGIPLAFAIVGWGIPSKRSMRPIVGSVIAAIVTTIGVGLICEIGQHFLPKRTESLIDVGAQTGGAIFGAFFAFAAQSQLRDTKSWLDRSTQAVPTAAFADLMFAGLVVWFLLPFQILVTPPEFARKWSKGQIELLPFTRPLESWGDLFSEMVLGVGIGAIIGAWIWWGSWIRAYSRRSFLVVLVASISASCLLELVQIGIATRVASATDSFFLAVGAVITITCVKQFSESERTNHLDRRIEKQLALLLAVAFVFMAWCFVEWRPYEYADSTKALRQQWTNFRESPLTPRRTSNWLYLSDLFRTVVMSAIVGGLLGTISSINYRSDWTGKLLVFLALVALVSISLTIEVGKFVELHHRVDVSELIVRFLAMLFCFVAIVRISLLRKPNPSYR